MAFVEVPEKRGVGSLCFKEGDKFKREFVLGTVLSHNGGRCCFRSFCSNKRLTSMAYAERRRDPDVPRPGRQARSIKFRDQIGKSKEGVPRRHSGRI